MERDGFPRRYVINGEEYYPAREVREYMEQKRPAVPVKPKTMTNLEGNWLARLIWGKEFCATHYIVPPRKRIEAWIISRLGTS